MSSVTQVGMGSVVLNPLSGEKGMNRSNHHPRDGTDPVGPQGMRQAVKPAAQDQRASGEAGQDDPRRSGGRPPEAAQPVPSSTSVRFSVDRELDKVVIRVVEKQSKEVVRQIPSDKMLALEKRMNDLTGTLYDREA